MLFLVDFITNMCGFKFSVHTAELADLKATLAELRLALASDRSTPLELPPLRPHVN